LFTVKNIINKCKNVFLILANTELLIFVNDMKNEQKIVELLSELVYKHDILVDENKKTNLAMQELQLSVKRLADEIVLVHGHEERIGTLEKIVLKS
jgi:hypothetical protein